MTSCSSARGSAPWRWNTSVAALLREYLEAFASEESGMVVRKRFAALARAARSRSGGKGRTWSRDDLHEVISPSTGARDRVTKRQLYAHHGVEHYWLVDPVARTLEALALRDGIWVDAGTFDETAVLRVAPFQAVELPVGRLFLPRAGGVDPEE